MPLIGLRSEDGTIRKEFKDIDIARDYHWLQPADPALIAYIIELQKERKDVQTGSVSASQIDSGIRELWLRDITPYYQTTTDGVAALMGNIKHSSVNIERENFVTETRLFSSDGLYSAKCDTYFVPLRLLADLKNVKWYKVKKMLTEGVLRAAKGYAYQLNLFRVLMKEKHNQETLYTKYPWLRKEDFDVKEMQLTCTPPDMDYKNKQEAKKLLGSSNPSVIRIKVPFIADEQIHKEYRLLHAEKELAFKRDYAPLCTPEERWERPPSMAPVKCLSYCPVADTCRAVSKLAGETHPLDAYKERKEVA
jgi:hypothetical protein